MTMVISAKTNTAADTALRFLDQGSRAVASSLGKLASGSRIVRASDDAASLAVGTEIKADVTALRQAAVNAGQGSSLLQVADGALAQTVDILKGMKSFTVQAHAGALSNAERAFLDKEFQALGVPPPEVTTTRLGGSAVADATGGNAMPRTLADDGMVDSAVSTTGPPNRFAIGAMTVLDGTAVANQGTFVLG